MPKDYFAILGITPLAGTDEIRRSYRRLAKEWHPDRHDGDAAALARFHEVREAYETLTDPGRKDAWLQERWYLRSMGIRTEDPSTTLPADVLKACIALEQEVSMKDPHRTESHALLKRIRGVLRQDVILLLCQEKDIAIREGVFKRLLLCGRHFNPEAASELVKLLEPLSKANAQLSEEATRYHSHIRRRQLLERVRIPLLLLATAIACILIARA